MGKARNNRKRKRKVFTDEQILGHKSQEWVFSKEYFPPSPPLNQRILVFLSRFCVLKGTVCEHSQLFHIKYYGSFDKSLRRYLRDDLFDQVMFFLHVFFFFHSFLLLSCRLCIYKLIIGKF